LGFAYRSKVMVTGTGTTTTNLGRPVVIDTRQAFGNPHIFRAGFAVSTLSDKLLIAMDVKYLMYAEAYRDIETVTIVNGAEKTTATPAHWKDSTSVHVGADLALSSTWHARAGYSMVTMATSADYASAFMPPPGISHGFAVGVGIRVLEELNVDLAATYASIRTEVEHATEHNAGVGIHAVRSGMFSLSATYRM
jgi:long-subunit fatty acid transport protein